jgi:Cob(I)alamin adenosyltransferase N terminal.
MNSVTGSNETLKSDDVADLEASGLTPEQYKRKMQRRKEVQEQRLAQMSQEQGLSYCQYWYWEGQDYSSFRDGVAIARSWLPSCDRAIY